MNNKDSIVSTKDGRKLQIREAGTPDGVPVLIHHGTPGSRLVYQPYVEDAQARGIRLISYDRPGFGGSTSHPDRSVGSVAEDVSAIAEHLNLDRLATWGESGGGPHTLACAALLPDLVVAAAVIASVAPYDADDLDWFVGMGKGNIESFGVALKGREPLEKSIEAKIQGILNEDAKGLVEVFSSLLSPADAAVFTDDVAAFMLLQLGEGIKGGGDGWIEDDLAFIKSWGFDLSQIKIPTLLLHGEQDRFVPLSHGEWLAKNIDSVEARFSADEGHLSLPDKEFPKVHAWLLEQMA